MTAQRVRNIIINSLLDILVKVVIGGVSLVGGKVVGWGGVDRANYAPGLWRRRGGIVAAKRFPDHVFVMVRCGIGRDGLAVSAWGRLGGTKNREPSER